MNGTDKILKPEYNEDIKPNVEVETPAHDQAMVDAEVLPDTAGTAHYVSILTRALKQLDLI